MDRRRTRTGKSICEFRHEFNLHHIGEHDYKLYISADTDYVVWLNGSFLACGQYSDYPQDKVYDVLDVKSFIRTGKNALCVLVYYQGESSSTYLKGEPGLWYTLNCGDSNIISGEEVACRKSLTYKNGPIPKITLQLSFTYEYDARNEDDWRSLDYDMGDNSWKPSCIRERLIEGKPISFNKRPIAKLNIKGRLDCRILAQGKFIRTYKKGHTVAQLVQTDFLSPLSKHEIFWEGFCGNLPSKQGVEFILSNTECESDQGIYLLIDVGREEAGIFEMEIEAHEGTIIDIGYGQHLDDLRVRAAVGGRNFANRYICKSGKQCFIHHTTRLGSRYIQLHISNVQDKFILYYAGIKPTEYPVEVKGRFRSSDSLWNEIYNVGIRTLHLCMHEHYEDTPWREQALYSMDSRNQALCGYYSFGDYDFPQASFDLLGKGLKEDGYLELCAPAQIPITIPCFSMAWIMELADHLLFSGRVEPAKLAMPKVKLMVDSYISNMEKGLLVSPQGKRYWHFYEWADGLDNSGIFRDEALDMLRFDTPLNTFFAMALDAACVLARVLGEWELADKYTRYSNMVKKAIEETFWDHGKQAFTTYIGEGCEPHFAELTQALILCAKACGDDKASILRNKLAEENNDMVETTLSHSLYKLEALLQDSNNYAQIVFGKIEKDWGYMLYKGATSFWETIKGSGDFDNAGSLCHGWSAIPVYFYQAYILGVKPLEPGFKSFKVDPVPSILHKASGKVPTPYGDIIVHWEQLDGRIECNITHPEEIKCIREGNSIIL
ncbi:MAG TPA: family 78 glycoside hydrolase catalytic domain [Clostridia bacterium]|nr:family 78 glycoside hydrolase catalytic domain [Clostridia bacterium]